MGCSTVTPNKTTFTYRDKENFVTIQGFLLCDPKREVGASSGREYTHLVCINTRVGEKGTKWEGKQFETKYNVYAGGLCAAIANKLLKGDEVMVVGELTSTGGKQSPGRNGNMHASRLAVSARVLMVVRTKKQRDADRALNPSEVVDRREYQDVGEEVDE